MTVRKCASCGAYHPKVFSWVDAEQKEYFFCNMECKKRFFDVLYPAMQERRKAENETSVLPQVRELIAHKDKDGRVTIVRGDG